MKKYFIVIFLMLLDAGYAWGLQSITLADTPLQKNLAITEVKVTGDEFVVLRNTTDSSLKLSDFWLQYFNDFELSRTSSATSFQLPAVKLKPGQEIMLAGGTAAACGPVWISKLSFNLKDSAGLLQVLNLDQAGGVVSYKPQDQVSWSSKSADNTDIKGVSGSAAKQIYFLGDNSWQASDTPVGCTAESTSDSPTTDTPEALSRSGSSPPSLLISDSDEPAALSGMPPADAGLAAPQLSEILPNPAPPKTDANDEYIELYNPNDQVFDLSNFKLQTGSSSYVFPEGLTSIEPKGFKAFYSSATNLSLPNGGGFVKLISPGGELLAASDEYAGAQDDTAWVFANGLWQWTTVPTPDARNITTAGSASVLGASSGAPPASKSTLKYAPLALSELLPNPKSPQTDAEDEFIEIYNPTAGKVNLTGYTLVTGTTDNHKFTIKDDSIGAKEYKVFYSSQTHLTMSNSEGRAKLLAPDGSQIDATADYAKAPEGQSWIFAGGKWQWTTVPTPDKANILTAAAGGTSPSSSSRGAAAVNSPAGQAGSAAQSSPVHPLILAGIGSAVLLYAGYEYRYDVANAIYRLRRNRGIGRASGPPAKTAGSGGITL